MFRSITLRRAMLPTASTPGLRVHALGNVRNALRHQSTSAAEFHSQRWFYGGVLLAAAVGGGGVGLMLGDMHRRGDTTGKEAKAEYSKPTFFAHVPSVDGTKTTTEHVKSSDAEVEGRLTRHATTQTFPGTRFCDVVRYDNNFVECLEPIEDRNMHDRFPVSALFAPDGIAPAGGAQGSGDIKMFSVLDGHGGWECSDVVSKTLHPIMLKSLQSLYSGNIPPSKRYQPYGFAADLLPTYVDALPPGSKTSDSIVPLLPSIKITPASIKASITAAFLALDQEIMTAATRLIDPVTKGRNQGVSPALAESVIRAGASGACALNLMVDESKEAIYVSNIGDCRAVAGYWVEPKDGIEGGWRCEILSDDHTTKNKREVTRMQKDHPKSEKDNIIWKTKRANEGITHRLMGGLIPIRTFGDSIYKWTRGETEALQRMAPNAVPPYPPQPHIKTPPYVTACPEITYKKLSPNDKNGELRFIVLATDGLWDCISSQDSVALVGAFLENQASGAQFSRKKLNSKLQPEPAQSLQRYAPYDYPSKGDDWTVKDDNAATHLIRNAYSICDHLSLQELLSLRPPHAKMQRDDITCSVVFFKGSSTDEKPSNAAASDQA